MCTNYRKIFYLLLFTFISVVLLFPINAQASSDHAWVFDPENPIWGGMDEPQQTSEIDDDKVVWMGFSSIPGYGDNKDRIFYKDLSDPAGAASVLVPKTSHQENPKIDGNLVAWLEGGTTRQIHYTILGPDCPGNCTDYTLNLGGAERARELAVSGNLIVWSDERPGAWQEDIYMYDINTEQETLVTDDSWAQRFPSVDGDWITWLSEGDYSSSGKPQINDIYAKRISDGEVRRITSDDGAIKQGHPSISEDPNTNETNVVYPGDGIWLIDVSDPQSTPWQISGMNGTSDHEIDGDKIVWNQNYNTVYLYDLTYGFQQQLTAGTAPAFHPGISGRRIVWSDDRSGVRNIYSLYLRELISTLGTDTCCGQAGDPINTSTGGFFYPETDIEIPTKGLPLSFVRTYNSHDQREGPLGLGWSHNWQISATTKANGDVEILRGDGRRDAFLDNGDSTYTSPSGRHDTLTKNPDATYTLLTQDQITYYFNGAGQLISAVAENGQATNLGYDTSQRLETITGPSNRTLTLSYTPESRIETITAPLGTSISFEYTPTGELFKVVDQELGETTYGYNPDRKIETITSPEANATGGGPFVNNVYVDGKVTEQTDALGNKLTFDYSVPYQTTITRVMNLADPLDNQVSIHYYDAAYRKTKEVDPYGYETVYSYDSAGNRDSVTDRRGTVTKQVFDPAGNPVDIYRALGTPEEQHTQTVFNLKNHPTSVTDARGNTTTYTYDATDIYLTRIDYSQVSNYDGTFTSYSESFTYNPDGTLATSTDRNGDETTYTYDANGYPDIITINSNRPASDQVVIDYGYDDLGRKTSETDGEGNTTTYGYNAIGDLELVTKQVTDSVTQLPVPVVTSYTYDKNGNRTSVIDPEDKTTTYEYTAMDNLRLITDALGNTIEHTYDEVLNRTGTKDRNGNWTNFQYDLDNRLAKTIDPESNETTYGYDEEGNQTAITDPLSNTTTRTYDPLGRLTSVTEPDEGGATRTTSFTYDTADNKLTTIDPLTHTTTNVYDELGRLWQATDATGNSVFYAYDGEGNQVKTKDQRGFETLNSFSPSDMLVLVTDSAGGVTAYAYDKNGNRISQTDAEGHMTLYAFDELSRLVEEKVDDGAGGYLLKRDYRYDRAGNLTEDITGEGAISYTHDDVYNMTGIDDRDAATYTFTYDGNQNQLLATEDATGKTVSYTYTQRGLIDTYTDAHGAVETFTYNGAANLIQRDDTVGGQNFTTTYGYTLRNQQKSVTRGADTTSFSYDPAGNLATKSYPNGLDTTFGYDEVDRMTSLETVKGAQTMNSYAQAYDPAGNLISQYDLRYGTSNFTYDSLNRLINEEQAGYGDISYTYDSTGNRLTLTTPKPAGGPDLTLSTLNVYWASQQDYLDRKLSIDYRTTNNGPGTAFAAEVTNSTATDGAYLLTAMPMSLGDISETGYADYTLKYYVPEGVENIQTTVYVKCKDQAGSTTFYYPEKRDFYAYNQANQLTQIHDQDANITSFTYDTNGALTEKAMGTSSMTLSYNGMDKLTQAATPVGTVDYAYDALGRRIQRTEDGYTRNLIYGATSDLYDHELDTNGVLAASMLKGPDGLISLTSYSGGTTTAYQNFNPHGDTTLISSPQGDEWIAARFDAFGNPLDGWELSYGYTSKWLREKDRDTQMIRMGVREYDPAIGRFMSVDPVAGDVYEPLRSNHYPYALNNPSTMYDLDGRSPTAVAVTGAIVVGSGPAGIIVAGGLAAGAAGAYGVIVVEPASALKQAEIYENNKCLLPAPSAHPDYRTHYGAPGLGVAFSEGEELADEMYDHSDSNRGKPVDREGSATDEFNKLRKGKGKGKRVDGYPKNGKGEGYEYPPDTFIGRRISEDGTPTVDLKRGGRTQREYKYRDY